VGRKTISAQVDEDGELWKEFSEYRQKYESKSEAVRAAVRAGIEAETEDADDGGRHLTFWQRGGASELLAGAAVAVAAVFAVLALVFSASAAVLALKIAATAGAGAVAYVATVVVYRRLSPRAPASAQGAD